MFNASLEMFHCRVMFKVGSFKLGNVVGTLLAGVVIGQIGVNVSPLVKVVFFDLFLFATGYKVGPQFFRSFGRQALAQASLTVVLCVTSLLTAYTAAKVMDYDAGTAAGLLAGAFTESTASWVQKFSAPGFSCECKGSEGCSLTTDNIVSVAGDLRADPCADSTFRHDTGDSSTNGNVLGTHFPPSCAISVADSWTRIYVR